MKAKTGFPFFITDMYWPSIAAPSNPPLAELQTMGVAWLNLGSAFVRAALGITQKIAADLHQRRSLAMMFSAATPCDEMNRLFDY